MSLAEYMTQIRRLHVNRMDKGLERETPGAVIEQTEVLTKKFLRQGTKNGAKKHQLRESLIAITAASIVEGELIEELRNQ